jgi:hypothetical protein
LHSSFEKSIIIERRSIQYIKDRTQSGKIVNGMDVSKVAELLSESHAFYDAEMISQLINSMLQYTQNSLIGNVTAAQVNYVMKQLKATGVPLP